MTPGAVYLIYGCIEDDQMYARVCTAADRALNSLPAAAIDRLVAALEAGPWAIRPEEEWAAALPAGDG